MRILLGCSLGGSGHLLPVASAATALEALGHETLTLVPPSIAQRATAAGLSVAVGDQPPAEFIDAVWARVRTGPPEAVIGLIDREVFAGRATDSMLAGAQAALDSFAPDLILREPAEFGTATVAHRAGIPQAQVAISQAVIEDRVLSRVGDRLDARSPGLVETIRTSPYLTRFPESLDPSPWADTRRFREPTTESEPLEDWWPGDERPLIYLSFGTVFGRLPEAAVAYAAAVDALATLPARVLLTLGPDAPVPGALRANVHAEPWVPQDAALRQARLVVCHGGSGTVFGALAHGVPLVVCPFFADQAANGRLIEAAGAGRVLRSTPPESPDGIATLTRDDTAALAQLSRQVLADETALTNARRIAAETAATPTLEAVLGELTGIRPVNR
jgi:UDP:flavonoid glycosyltransferase YjiC (YdhE family)